MLNIAARRWGHEGLGCARLDFERLAAAAGADHLLVVWRRVCLGARTVGRRDAYSRRRRLVFCGADSGWTHAAAAGHHKREKKTAPCISDEPPRLIHSIHD